MIVSVEGKSEAVDGNILGRADFSKYLFGIEVETFSVLCKLSKASNKDGSAWNSRRDCIACSWDVDSKAKTVAGSGQTESLLKSMDCNIGRGGQMV